MCMCVCVNIKPSGLYHYRSIIKNPKLIKDNSFQKQPQISNIFIILTEQILITFFKEI